MHFFQIKCNGIDLGGIMSPLPPGIQRKTFENLVGDKMSFRSSHRQRQSNSLVEEYENSYSSFY